MPKYILLPHIVLTKTPSELHWKVRQLVVEAGVQPGVQPGGRRGEDGQLAVLQVEPPCQAVQESLGRVVLLSQPPLTGHVQQPRQRPQHGLRGEVVQQVLVESHDLRVVIWTELQAKVHVSGCL